MGNELKTTTPVPQVLLSWRERMGFSQRDACVALGCSRGAWAKWETGKAKAPKYIGLACAALALGMKAYGDDRELTLTGE
jgi:transcriptional regulator with XRE-family HTH domain